MLLLAAADMRSKEYEGIKSIDKKVVTFFPTSGHSATAALKFSLNIKCL